MAHRTACQENHKTKKPLKNKGFLSKLAEAVRFELTDPFGPPVFKTGAIDHSATPPQGAHSNTTRGLAKPGRASAGDDSWLKL